MNSSNYEIVYIIDNDVTEIKKVQDKITALLGVDQAVHKSLGNKKFAYPIKKKVVGHYFLLNVLVEKVKIQKFIAEIRWISEVVRFLVVNLDEEKHFRFPKFKTNDLQDKLINKDSVFSLKPLFQQKPKEDNWEKTKKQEESVFKIEKSPADS